MAIGARRTKTSSSDNPKPGVHKARLVGIIDMGLQPGFVYQGKEIEPAYQLRLSYELPSSRTEDNRPHWVHETVKNSDYVDKKKGLSSKLMKRVYALDPSGERSDNGKNLNRLIGTPCMVEVGLNNGGYPKVNNVTGAPADYPIPDLENEPVLFDMENPNLDVFNRLPEFLQNQMREALDFEGSKLYMELMKAGDEGDDDVAF